ncbi:MULTISPECIES: hypothetical protein [unclassified Endozoicomonas]|uniref:hypothetical protein n=1 Tax=unclassified Endozoicomonas TaxID=2644528 RepID=UPI00214854AD|nr:MULTISPECIES: hypothetical protein [unclassified Endozoicomonas]
MTTPVSNVTNKGLLSTIEVAKKQSTFDSHKAGATFYNRSVECVEPSVSIKIDRSKNRCTTLKGLAQSHMGMREVTLKYIPFEIDGTIFNCINGNERDNELAEKMMVISDDCSKSSFSFNIKTEDGNHEYKPSHFWQEQLLKCINAGLQVFFDDCPPDKVVPLLANKTVGNIYKGKKIPTTCFQFVNFMEFNSNSFQDNFRIELTILKNSKIENQFIPVAILNNNEIVHIFIHIGDDVCIGKLGGENIFFHTAEDILNHYQESFENPLTLAIANIKPLP